MVKTEKKKRKKRRKIGRKIGTRRFIREVDGVVVMESGKKRARKDRKRDGRNGAIERERAFKH